MATDQCNTTKWLIPLVAHFLQLKGYAVNSKAPANQRRLVCILHQISLQNFLVEGNTKTCAEYVGC